MGGGHTRVTYSRRFAIELPGGLPTTSSDVPTTPPVRFNAARLLLLSSSAVEAHRSSTWMIDGSPEAAVIQARGGREPSAVEPVSLVRGDDERGE